MNDKRTHRGEHPHTHALSHTFPNITNARTNKQTTHENTHFRVCVVFLPSLPAALETDVYLPWCRNISNGQQALSIYDHLFGQHHLERLLQMFTHQRQHCLSERLSQKSSLGAQFSNTEKPLRYVTKPPTFLSPDEIRLSSKSDEVRERTAKDEEVLFLILFFF